MSRAVSTLAKRPDPTVYPVSGHRGESTFELFTRVALLTLFERHLAARGQATFVGSKQFIYWVQFEPTRSVCPALYVVPGLAPRTRVGNIKTWLDGRVPSFALEIASPGVSSACVQLPERYAELGVRELVIYDPKAARRRGEGVVWQVYRRLSKRGFVQVEATQADRVRSKVLGCFLREVRGAQGALELRLGAGPSGDELVPTEAESERAEKERERAEKEPERAARLEAEAEVAKLRALLTQTAKR